MPSTANSVYVEQVRASIRNIVREEVGLAAEAQGVHNLSLSEKETIIRGMIGSTGIRKELQGMRREIADLRASADRSTVERKMETMLRRVGDRLEVITGELEETMATTLQNVKKEFLDPNQA